MVQIQNALYQLFMRIITSEDYFKIQRYTNLQDSFDNCTLWPLAQSSRSGVLNAHRGIQFVYELSVTLIADYTILLFQNT